MMEISKAVQISDNVYWVGAIDWGIRDFHGYSTSRGSTYNAYLVMADKVTLIDTVKAPFRQELMARISSVIDPSRIDYIISNHAEMDHSGCLAEVIADVKPEKVFASAMGAKALGEHFTFDLEILPVKDGESLSLGNMEMVFYESRMLHWPDSMISYLRGDEVLFSQDAFGMHVATSERFADELPDRLLEDEGGRYFANILLPFSGLVKRLAERLVSLGITPAMIAPDHGPIWRENIGRIVELYGRWAAQKPGKKAVIVYDTMWQSTAAMARAIGEGVIAGGVELKLMSLKSFDRSDVAAEILDAGALLVGSPTLNNNMFPTVADVLIYLKGLKPANLVGAAFGSFGWSGEAPGQVRKALEAMGVEIVEENVRSKFIPGAEALESCFSLGKAVAERLGRERGCAVD